MKLSFGIWFRLLKKIRRLVVTPYDQTRKADLQTLITKAKNRMKVKPICPYCKIEMMFRQSGIGGLEEGALGGAPIRDDQSYKCPKCFYGAWFGIPMPKKEALKEIYLRGNPILSAPRVNPVDRTEEMKRRLKALGYMAFKRDMAFKREMNRTLTLLALILSIVVAIGALTFAVVNLTQQPQFRISNVAAIKTLGVTVWNDVNLTTQVSFIDWGVIGPGENTTFTCYVRSEANIPSTLSLWTENWQPANATTWISLSWNLEDVEIEVGEVLEAQLTLTVSPDIENITNFSFDIVIAGSG